MFELIKNKPIIIPVPNKAFLDAEEGFEFAEAVIRPLQQAIVTGPQEIIVTVPQERPIYNAGRTAKTIQGAFFAGMLQDLLIQMRDHHLPSLQFAAARNNLRVAAGQEKRPLEIGDIAQLISGKPWEVYAPLETLFREKVRIGLSYSDGNLLLADIGTGRYFSKDLETDDGINLYFWSLQLARGLDATFVHDLKFNVAEYREFPKYLRDSSAKYIAG